MSTKTVRQLAEVVKIPLERLLEELKKAGLSARAPDDVINADEKMHLLAHLRNRHAKDGGAAEASLKRVTLKRRTVSELKQASVPDSATKTISVEVRKAKTYIKTSKVVDDTEQQKEQEPVKIAQMTLNNLTVFSTADLKFGSNLNVIVGENGTGKTHLLKMIYSVLSVSAEEGRKPKATLPTKSVLQTRLADKLFNNYRPDSLGRLVKRKGRERCEINLELEQKDWDIAFSFASNSKSEVSIEKLPNTWVDVSPVYLPTRELLTLYPNFISVYEGHYLDFEETWRDTCSLLGGLIQRGTKEKRIRELLEPLEIAMGGAIVLDRNGRFYLRTDSGSMEMPLVAEGLRKLGMLARLIATGALLDKGYLFWDEPESNLNPILIKQVAKSILDLCDSGIQIFIATHSLFLLRELEILLSDKNRKKVDARFFGLHQTEDGVRIDQGSSIDDIGDIAALDEELAQSDRFLAVG